MKYSNVKVCSQNQPVKVAITSDEKPAISEEMVENWQKIIDLLASNLNVPSALIMKLSERQIHVFLGSNTRDNPYIKGESANLLSGLYCETVVGNKSSLLVSNALEDSLWKSNPDIKLDMISYLGLSILWPDGEVFGTICALDNKENSYNNQQFEIMSLLKDSIQKDLKLLLEEKILKDELKNKEIEEKKLIKSENRYKKLFNNMRSAVIICNVKNEGENFIIQDVNKAMELIEKDSRANIIGKNLKIFINKNSQIDLLNIIKQVWKTGNPEKVVVNGEYKINNFRDNYYIYKLSHNEIVVIYDDISEIIEYQKKISENERLISEAIELENLRTQFFANISHELRTPLNIILGSIQIDMLMLKDEEKLLDRKKIINNINIEKQNCFRLLRLINNLIDSTKLDLRDVDPVMANFNIVDIIEDISQSVAEYIHGNDLKLVFDTNIEEKIISCDLDKIERIMLNLLSNSIKFTEPGGSIFVNFIDGDKFVTITVEDTGIGIEEDKLSIIFDKFRQIDKSFSRRNEGSGIGLSIVKSLVEVLNGSISVESKLGVGTKFIIKLPVNKVVEDKLTIAKSKLSYETFNNRVEKIKIEFSDIYKLGHNMNFA